MNPPATVMVCGLATVPDLCVIENVPLPDASVDDATENDPDAPV